MLGLLKRCYSQIEVYRAVCSYSFELAAKKNKLKWKWGILYITRFQMVFFGMLMLSFKEQLTRMKWRKVRRKSRKRKSQNYEHMKWKKQLTKVTQERKKIKNREQTNHHYQFESTSDWIPNSFSIGKTDSDAQKKKKERIKGVNALFYLLLLTKKNKNNSN